MSDSTPPMTQRLDAFTDSGDGDVAPALIAIDVATAALRRGVPVVVKAGPEDAALVLAIEVAPAHAVAMMDRLCGKAPHIAWSVPGVPGGRPRTVVLEAAAAFGPEQWRQFALPRLEVEEVSGDVFVRRAAPVPASVDAGLRLAKHAGLLPRILIAPLPGAGAVAWAAERHLPLVRAADVKLYQDKVSETLRPVGEAVVPLSHASRTRIVAFRPASGDLEHLAIIVGAPDASGPVLARLHSACLTGDLLGSLRCDCGDQLRGAIAAMDLAGGGVLLYLAQEGRGIGLVNKLRAYGLQDQGFDTIDANRELGFEADERMYRPAAEMLRQLGFSEVRLMTNNPDKVAALGQYGITIVERVPHAFPANPHNARYLRTKARRSGHHLEVA